MVCGILSPQHVKWKIISFVDLENRVDALEISTSELDSQVSDLAITTGDHETRIDTIEVELAGWLFFLMCWLHWCCCIAHEESLPVKHWNFENYFWYFGVTLKFLQETQSGTEPFDKP